MLKKLILFTAILFAMTVSSVGCSNSEEGICTSESDLSQSTIANDSTDSESMSIDMSKDAMLDNQITFADGFVLQDFESRYDDAKSSYPDKTVLVWACDEDIRYEDELNAYLNENDYPFVIVFRNLTPSDDELYDDNGNFKSSYAEGLKSAIADGEQIDIVSTGYRFALFDTFFNSYHYFVDNEILLPIEDMIKQTDIGKSFYDDAPENYWSSLTYNGHVYGVDGYLSGLNNKVCLQINTNIVSENELLSITGESYSELLYQLYDISDAKSESADSIYQITPHYLEDLSMFTDYDFIWSSIYIDENGVACNIYEAPEIVELFNALSDGFNQGYIVHGTDKIENTIADFSYTRCGDIVQNHTVVDSFFGTSAMNGSAEGYRIYPNLTKSVHSAQNVTGVYSKSENADLAVQALLICLCNEECNNLLCFGTDYEIKSGCISPNGYYNTIIVENRLAHNPFFGLFSTDVRQDYVAAYENGVLSSYVGFTFDTSSVASELLAIEEIMYSVSDEFPSDEFLSGEEYLSSLNKRMYDAGLQDVLDEANRQLEKYNEENS